MKDGKVVMLTCIYMMARNVENSSEYNMYIGQVCICICVYITYMYQKLEFKQHSAADFVWALDISFPNSCHTSENPNS